MKIVTTTSVFPPCWDAVNVIERLAAIGYDALDMAFDYCTQEKDYPFMTEDYENWACMLREKAEKLGVAYTHSHAPFDASARGDLVERSLRCASLLGIRYMVVHPVCRNENGTIENEEEFIRLNAQLIRPQLEVAEKHGVILLSENLLWGASIHAQTISKLVDEVDSPWFGWCYDAGHAHAFHDGLDAFRKVSRAPLSLHIQDNEGRMWDSHLIPGDGTLDWGDFLRALKDVGYPGEFVLEAHHQSLEMPDEERDGFLAELLERSRKMNAYYESL